MTRIVRRVVHLDPGELLDHRDAWWQDAIVLVLAGELDVECAAHEPHLFRTGDILTLAHLPLLCARNSGAVPARLLAISRADR